MAEPTLTQVFGANAQQDLNFLTISKTDLVTVGLTAAADNTAEALLAAVVQLAMQNLTEANRDLNSNQSIAIYDNSDSLVTRGEVLYRRKSKTIEFDKLDNQSAFDPDDY